MMRSSEDSFFPKVLLFLLTAISCQIKGLREQQQRHINIPAQKYGLAIQDRVPRLTKDISTWDIAVPGKEVVHCSNDPLLGGDPSKLNPEDFLLSALSACHMLW